MENIVEVEGHRIALEFVQKPWIRNTYLRFDDDRLVVISRSYRMMQRMIEKHRPWILKHYKQIKSSIRLFEANALFYNSQRYEVLHIKHDARPKADISEGRLVVYARDAHSANRFIENMLRDDTLRFGESAIAEKSALIGVSTKEIVVRRCRKWGACRSNGTITLNSCIAMLPKELQDYIIAHEVAHLKQMNHSRRFWKVVGEICSDYKQHRRALRKYDNKRREIIPSQ